MWKYVLKRICVLIPMILLVSFIVYGVMDLAPGDPIFTMYPEASEAEREMMREELGYNDPVVIRYVRYMSDVLRGDLGTSLYSSLNVWDEFMARLPYTIVLACSAMALTLIIAIPMGIWAATNHNSWLDTGASVFSIVGQSVPNFWLGLLLVLLFAVNLGWLPSTGADAGVKSLILPTVTLALQNMALVMRTTRSSMLDCIRADYLRTAKAKGVSQRKLIWHHALRNALIPIVTIAGSQFSILIAGAAVVESVFAWPGIGQLIVQSIRTNDYTMTTGGILLTTVLTSTILLMVDVSYALVDPRIKAKYTK